VIATLMCTFDDAWELTTHALVMLQGRADGGTVVIDGRSSDGPGHLYAGWEGEFLSNAKMTRNFFLSENMMADG
jgi:hypothetical protein